MGTSYGLIEVSGVVAAIDSLDAMCKASDVTLVTWERTLGGRLVPIIVEGGVSDVKAAVEAAQHICEENKHILAAHGIIAAPSEEIRKMVALSARRLQRKKEQEAVAEAQRKKEQEAAAVAEAKAAAEAQPQPEAPAEEPAAQPEAEASGETFPTASAGTEESVEEKPEAPSEETAAQPEAPETAQQESGEDDGAKQPDSQGKKNRRKK